MKTILSEPYFSNLETAQNFATTLDNKLPDDWFWIFDCEKKEKVQEFEKDHPGNRY